MSNSPTFDWHMTNLSNYVNMTVNNVPKFDVDGKAIKGLGQGSGMLGIPGDFTPPSRFVRAVAFSKSALPVETAREAVLQAFHILNQFDIPKGAARGIGAWQGGCGLHAMDKHSRSEKPPVLLPNLRQQPDSDGRPEGRKLRCQEDQDHLDSRETSRSRM